MSGPLEGIKVLSFGRALAGPFCTMLLCDLGAEVMKVEEPGRGDLARLIGPRVQGISSYFLSINRGTEKPYAGSAERGGEKNRPGAGSKVRYFDRKFSARGHGPPGIGLRENGRA
jgi:hypothetical protein